MQTIENWLSQFALGKYIEAFVQNDVDLRALSLGSLIGVFLNLCGGRSINCSAHVVDS
jgi:hypothetical protein